MKINKDAIFLLTGSNSGSFGTGFAVACRENKVFIVTCAHVVTPFNDCIKANDHEAELLFLNDTIDIAILSIPNENNEYRPVLNRIVRGESSMKIHICGYSLFDKKTDTYAIRNIKGKLGENIRLTSDKGEHIDSWDIFIDDKDDIFSKMRKGYSGSPICDDAGGLIAVASHNIGMGEFGHAISICDVENIYKDTDLGSIISFTKKKIILFIDDDNDWHSIFHLLIDNKNYQVVYAESLKKAVDNIRDETINPDLVCINIGLEGDHIKYSFMQKWIKLLKKIKKRGVPTIIITGNREINCITKSENNLISLKEIIYGEGNLPCDATPFLYKGSDSLEEEFLSYINQMITI